MTPHQIPSARSKAIEKSSLFRRTIEGRAVLDILRTILQTAVAADVPVHRYLVDVLKSDPKEIADHPERFTPLAWAKRQPTGIEFESNNLDSTL